MPDDKITNNLNEIIFDFFQVEKGGSQHFLLSKFISF